METLAAGAYYIRNGPFPFSRSHIEDKSLNPKAVFTLWKGSEEKPASPLADPRDEISCIHLQQSKRRSRPTGVLPESGHKQKLFALLRGERATVWKVEPVALVVMISYVITSAVDGKFWVSTPPQPGAVPGEEHQIEVKTLILNPVDPRYSSEAIFEIVRA
ncbi:hypothetical protein D9757_013619 [Collybiopsis confluens]|uniref:Uncharacterized protein n=1 Tax=Collybiopsis confluens TaxID=2823264 RepID=A0A8H5FUS4_9AGAR|nr:hypothetical protein D9757_013619 [Collybiopsis confluens]